jgi:thioredoxin reductase
MSIRDRVIVGAGPYGLSIAAHLRAAGAPFDLYGTPLESWRAFMPVGMFLKSERFASSLWDPGRRFTLERFSRERNIPYRRSGIPLSLKEFLNYAEWFRQLAVGDTVDLKVKRIRRNDNSFILDFSEGPPIEARRVILATGHMAFRRMPEELSGIPEPLCYHSAVIHELTRFSSRDVTLIGGGQSALETAALLCEVGARVRVIVRKGIVNWNPPLNGHRSLLYKARYPEAGLGSGWNSVAVSEMPQLFRRMFPVELRHRYVARSWGPSGAWWLRERVEGRFEILLNQKLRRATQDGNRVCLELEGPQGMKVVATDHVIAATGYKVDLNRLDYLDSDMRREIAHVRGAPVLNSQFETSIPGLFIVGVASAPTFGPVMRFMFGAKHVAPVLARRLR